MKTVQRPETPNYIDMRGTSMLPVLHTGEAVTIDPDIDRTALQIGDIIAYSDPRGSSKRIIHRIIKKCKDGYITRGDNNRGRDDYIVRQEHIIGKALTVRRVDKTIRLSDGFKGQVLHQWLKLKKKFRIYCLRWPSTISRQIERSRVFNVFHRLVKFDVVTIRKRGIDYKILLINKKLIGRQCADTGGWQIRFPYKYFIDKNKL